jgi:competence protein ComEC
LRSPDGGIAILRDRAGNYVRDMLGESAGEDGELGALESMPSASCSDDLCTALIQRDGRTWRLLATRSPRLVPWRDMIRACAEADIVVSDRRLPPGCRPRWLKADRTLLSQTGGLAIRFSDPPQVDTVADRVARHPWAAPAMPFSRAGQQSGGRPRAP